jgi:hypothetical protein
MGRTYSLSEKWRPANNAIHFLGQQDQDDQAGPSGDEKIPNITMRGALGRTSAGFPQERCYR